MYIILLHWYKYFQEHKKKWKELQDLIKERKKERRRSINMRARVNARFKKRINPLKELA